MSNIGLGYITAYNPERATVDIRTINGNTLSGLPFDSSLAMYGTPVVSVTRRNEATGKEELLKAGTFVLYVTMDAENIRILRTFNDDQAIVSPSSGRVGRIDKGEVTDTLLYTLQEGEMLLTAPGVISEISANKFQRVPGSWMLLKNSGEVLLSNADTSAQLLLDYDGGIDLRGVGLSLTAASSKLYTDSDGSLLLEAGSVVSDLASLKLGTDGAASLLASNSSAKVYRNTVELNSQDISAVAGNSLKLGSPSIEIAGNDIALASETTSLVAPTSVSIATGAGTITADTTLNLAAGTSFKIAVGENIIEIKDDTISITAKTGLSLKMGESDTITVTDAGIDISSKKGITFNQGQLNVVATAKASAPLLPTDLVPVPVIKLGF